MLILKIAPLSHLQSPLCPLWLMNSVRVTERFHRFTGAPMIDLPEVLRSGDVFFHERAKRVIPFRFRSIPMDLVGRGLTHAAG